MSRPQFCSDHETCLYHNKVFGIQLVLFAEINFQCMTEDDGWICYSGLGTSTQKRIHKLHFCSFTQIDQYFWRCTRQLAPGTRHLPKLEIRTLICDMMKRKTVDNVLATWIQGNQGKVCILVKSPGFLPINSPRIISRNSYWCHQDTFVLGHRSNMQSLFHSAFSFSRSN